MEGGLTFISAQTEAHAAAGEPEGYQNGQLGAGLGGRLNRTLDIPVQSSIVRFTSSQNIDSWKIIYCGK